MRQAPEFFWAEAEARRQRARYLVSDEFSGDVQWVMSKLVSAVRLLVRALAVPLRCPNSSRKSKGPQTP